MIDTIILEIPESKFVITDPSKFSINPDTMRRMAGFVKSYNNPTGQDKALDKYMPRLTLIKRGCQLFLKIEFSAPKLLWHNNVDEVSEEEFEKIVEILRGKLADMGVKIWTHEIKKASVICFHPSKNILFNDGYTSTFVISELRKVDISKVFDWDEKEYRNNGRALQMYTNSHAFILYDKIYDLSKPNKRAIDKHQSKYQRSLFDLLKENSKRIEILRLEVRLSKKVKMNEILEKTGYDKNPTFEDIFKRGVCQKIINYYWQEYFGEYRYIFNISNNPKRLLSSILKIFPNIKISQALKWIGILMLLKDDEGIRGLRNVLEASKIKNSWFVIKKQIYRFKDKLASESSGEFIRNIERQLKEFKPFKQKVIHF